MSEQKVWAVSSGSYSDYSIDVVFERQADAETYAAADEDREVEEWTVRPQLGDPRTLYGRSARVIETGTVEVLPDSDQQVFPEVEGDPLSGKPISVYGHYGLTIYQADAPACMTIAGRSYDLGRLEKAISERVARAKADIPIWTAKRYDYRVLSGPGFAS